MSEAVTILELRRLLTSNSAGVALSMSRPAPASRIRRSEEQWRWTPGIRHHTRAQRRSRFLHLLNNGGHHEDDTGGDLGLVASVL